MDYLREYERKTRASKKAFERALKVMPGGVSHDLRFYPPYPIYLRKASGSKIWDLDLNEYVDFWMGHFALILGHSPDFLAKELEEQLKLGTHWGTVSELSVELANLVCDFVPCAEKVRFCNTGTEATMYAIRLARAYSGKKTILKAEGGWHGANTELTYAISKPFEERESLGLLKELERYCKTFPFNDLTTLDIIKKTENLAALIIEPVLGANGFIPAKKEYLKALREEAERREFVLIFDEVITGFRLGLGGAQEYYGIKPHLTTLGKILGGGLPIGAVAGEEEILNLASPMREKHEKVKIGGGTFSCNPLSMRAGIAMLKYLRENKKLFKKIGNLGTELRERLNREFHEKDFLAISTGIESLFQIHLPFERCIRLESARDVLYHTDTNRRDSEFKVRLINKGFYTMHGGGAISEAHTRKELDEFLKASLEALGEIYK